MHEQRKSDHIRINLEENVDFQSLTTGLEAYHFLHQAVPELDLAQVSRLKICPGFLKNFSGPAPNWMIFLAQAWGWQLSRLLRNSMGARSGLKANKTKAAPLPSLFRLPPLNLDLTGLGLGRWFFPGSKLKRRFKLNLP